MSRETPVHPASTPSRLSAQVLDPSSGFAQIRREWQTLAETVPGAAWSCLPEVFKAWTEILRDPGRVRIVAAHDEGGQLRGVMPLAFDFAWRGPSFAPRYDYDPVDLPLVNQKSLRPFPVRQLTTMSSMPATMLWIGPLCHASDRPSVMAAMAAAILRHGGWTVAVLPAERGPEAEGWRAAFGATRARAHLQVLDRHVRDLHDPQPFDAIVARQNKKFRQNIRRARAAAESAGLRFDILTGRAAVRAEFDTIARIARASWKQTGREGTDAHIPYIGQQQAFFERLLAAPDLGAEPILGVAADAEGPLDVLLMLGHGTSVTALLTFWDGRHPKASPGLLLMGKAIDHVAAAGAQRFEFNATAPWVRHFVNHEREICNVVVFAPTMAGRLCAKIATATGRLA